VRGVTLSNLELITNFWGLKFESQFFELFRTPFFFWDVSTCPHNFLARFNVHNMGFSMTNC
jgi:hypothetical protein